MSQTRERDFLPIYLRSAALTLLAVGPCFAVMVWHGWSPEAPLGPIALSIIAGAALWTIALYLMDHLLVHEARWLLVQMGLRTASTSTR